MSILPTKAGIHDEREESRTGRLIFIGCTSADAMAIRDTLREVYPDWLYNWQPDGVSGVAYMMDNGLADIALINANIEGMPPSEVVGWIRASPSPRPVPIVIFDAPDDKISDLLDCRADALVKDSDLGRRDLVKIAAQMIQYVRLSRLQLVES